MKSVVSCQVKFAVSLHDADAPNSAKFGMEQHTSGSLLLTKISLDR